jgi:hypothetical protein
MSTVATVITGLSAFSGVAASAAAILAGINHTKVKNVQATVNGRLREALEMLAHSAAALATSEEKRHEADGESKDKGLDNSA